MTNSGAKNICHFTVRHKNPCFLIYFIKRALHVLYQKNACVYWNIPPFMDTGFSPSRLYVY